MIREDTIVLTDLAGQVLNKTEHGSGDLLWVWPMDLNEALQIAEEYGAKQVFVGNASAWSGESAAYMLDGEMSLKSHFKEHREEWVYGARIYDLDKDVSSAYEPAGHVKVRLGLQ